MGRWHEKHGAWWMVQLCIDGWLSFGIHIDFRNRKLDDGRSYGPYVDLHIGCVIVSFGVRPYLTGDLEAIHTFSRGGVRLP